MSYLSDEKEEAILFYLVDGCCRGELEEFKGLDTSSVTLTKNYSKKRSRIINGIYWAPIKQKLKRFIVSVAVIMLMMLVGGTTVVFAVTPFRQIAVETVIEYFFDKGYGLITFEEEEKVALDKILDYNVPVNLRPTIEIEDFSTPGIDFVADYYEGDYWIGNFRQQIKREGTTLGVNTENAIIYDIVINGITATIYDSPQSKSAYWEDEYYFYTMASDTVSDIVYLINAIE